MGRHAAGQLLFGVVVFLAAFAQSDLPAIAPGKAIERSIAPGEVHRYPLDLPAKRVVRMTFTQNSPFDVAVKLAAPDGRALIERSGRKTLILSSQAETAGRYLLEVSARKEGGGSSRYTIAGIEIRPPAANDDTLLQTDAAYCELHHASAAPAQGGAAKLDAAAAYYAQAGLADSQGWALLLAGQYQARLSEFKQAADRYSRAAATFQTAGDLFGQAQALDYLGQMHQVLRDYPKAIETASQELTLARAQGLPDLEAGALTILGNSYESIGERQRALELLQEALAVAHKLSDRGREAAALLATAGLHRSLRNFDKALALYHEAVGVYHATGDRLREAATLNGIGGTYGYRGQPAKALEYFQQAIAVLRTAEGGRAALATTLSNSGQALLSTHQPAKAVVALEEALAIFREMGNRWDQVYTLATLGRAKHALNDLDGAAAMLNESLSKKEENDDPSVEACTRLDFARLESTRGNLEEARAHIAAAIDVVESVRNRVAVPELRSSLIASLGEYYDLHVDLLMQLYRQTGSPARLEEARVAADRWRARNLIDVLAAAGVKAAPARDPQLAAREQQLRQNLREISGKRTGMVRSKADPAKIAVADGEFETAWTEYQGVRAKLIAADPETAALADPTALNLDALRREVLDPDTLLLEYALGKEHSYLWAVSVETIQGFELPKRSEIEETARTFWEGAKSGMDHDAVERAAQRLSRMVLTPARPLLARKRLLIVADGALQYVPFAALADPAQAGAYRPLILAHEVIHEPSASALALLRRGEADRQPARHALAVFADPIFESDDPRLRRNGREAASAGAAPAFLTRAADLRLARLPATRQEGRAIASLAPESERWLALDFDANRSAATSSRLADYRILHFATHGVLESSRPELSALALSLYDAQGKPQDGFLPLYEIYNLKIQAGLVVLSACQTALGKNVRGEGLVGLARGFMHAGAPRVVASLWKVDDQATSELMRQFYAAMLGPQKKPAAAALRAAQNAVANQERWRSPYYWAAFVLQGEWK
jgi:CHAT domain-containing protein